MNADVLKREIAVAFSRRAQPVWFRTIKWIVLVVLVAWTRRSPHFWPVAGAVLGSAVVAHLFYRWKTRGWTRPWGGWNDPTFTRAEK